MTNNLKKHVKHIGNVLAIISLFLLIKIFIENFKNLHLFEFSIKNISIIFFLMIWGLVNYAIFSYAWILQTRTKYPNFKFVDSFKIIALTQIAKYLPGNIGHLVSRYYLAKKFISNADITYTFFIENLMFISASLFIGSFYFCYVDEFHMININTVIIIGLTIFSFGMISYFILSRLRNKMSLLFNNKETLIKILFLFMMLTIFGGINIYILIDLLETDIEIPFYLCVSGFAISFSIGFLVPGAPGGIGVREYTFTLLFTPFLGTIYALEVIVIFRLITILSDLLLFSIGKILNKKIKFEEITFEK